MFGLMLNTMIGKGQSDATATHYVCLLKSEQQECVLGLPASSQYIFMKAN